MKFLVKAFAAIICLLGAASCIHEDNDDCPSGLRVQIVKDPDVFESDSSFVLQSDEARVCVFDASGHYLKSVLTTGAQLRSNNFYVDIDDIEAGTYTLIAWIGSQDEDYGLSDLVAGQTTASEALLTLQESGTNRKDDYLHPLWYGKVTATVVNGKRQVVKVPMIQDTNYLTVLLVDDRGKDMNSEDFSFKITSANSEMDFENTIKQSERIEYNSYYVVPAEKIQTSDGREVTGVHAELSTMRLMMGAKDSLFVTYKPTDYKFVHIDLDNMLVSGREYYEYRLGRKLTNQEYLDFENHFSIIFHVNSSDVTGKPYIVIYLNIKGWIVRMNEIGDL